MRSFAPVALFGLFVVSGCATSSAAEAPPKEFKPIGEIRFAQTGESFSASFSEDRVVSPNVDLSKTAEGGWRGRIGNSIIDVNVYPDRIGGSGLTVRKENSDPGREVFTAQVEGKIFRFELDPKQALIRAPGFSATLGHNGDNTFGPGGILKLTGAATERPMMWPQLPLALIATFASAAHARGHTAN